MTVTGTAVQAAGMDPIVVAAIIGGIVATIGAIATLIGVLSKSSADRRTAVETRLDARYDALAKRQDAEIEKARTEASTAGRVAQEAKDDGMRHMRAVGRVFRRIQPMLPPEGPDIDPADIADLEDTEVLPPAWIRQRPQAQV